jgi:hypothetical protein
MVGETDLAKLLASISPRLMDGEFVFCTFANARYGDHAELEPIGAFCEQQGLTLVIPLLQAVEHGLKCESVFKGITLGVHSSLNAVGLTAAFSAKLAECGISANVIAGYHHDHIFVPSAHAQRALDALNALAVPPLTT